VTESTGTQFRKLSDAMRNGGPGPIFPGIGISNTTPLRPNFGSLCVPEPFINEK
jgi:hypothetical protein